MKHPYEVIKIRTFSIIMFVITVLPYTQNAQVTIKEYTVKNNSAPTTAYDSLSSSVSDPTTLLGQEIFWLPKVESLRDYPIYKVGTSPDLSNSSKMDYDDVANKYYNIVQVLPRPNDARFIDQDSKVLKLEEKESRKIIYFLYEPRYGTLIESEFVPLGYLSKLKATQIGTFWVLRRNLLDGKPLMIDMKTGNRDVDWKAHIWKCVDVAVESRYYGLALILENDIHQQIPLHASSLNSRNSRFFISIPSKDFLDNKFGTIEGKLVAAGKVQIGMTSEMCKYAWGEPDDINTTVVGSKKTEQWVYGSSFLYLTDGLLTGIQN